MCLSIDELLQYFMWCGILFTVCFIVLYYIVLYAVAVFVASLL